MTISSLEIRKIVVFRALQIGDMLCAIPAIRALRSLYPEAEITLVGLPWAKMLLERFPRYFDKLIVFPGFPGFPEQPFKPADFPGFLTDVQAQRFDLAIQMHGSGLLSNPLVALFDARYTAGYYIKDNYCPDKKLFIYYPGDVHEVYRHLRLVESLGADTNNIDLEFPILEKDEVDFELAQLPVKPKEYVVIHPGARGASRQWAPENFADVADECVGKGFKVVITGIKEEMDIVEKVIGLMKHGAVNAAGRTSLGAVAFLIKNAAALVSNCTGVAHIAAALKTKSIVVSLDVEPWRWAPIDQQIHKTIVWEDTPNLQLVKDELNGLLIGQFTL